MNDKEILEFVIPYTLCSDERILNVLDLIDVVAKKKIPGDFVEIGVFQGGIIMAMALKLKQLGLDRKIYAYDTFTGMTPPTEDDRNLHDFPAILYVDPKSPLYSENTVCQCPLGVVMENVKQTQYSNIVFCKGDILHTDIQTIPTQIALLRLDTDWHESTKFELRHFEPNVVSGGFVIIDDYGHWLGARKAVNEFLETHPQTLYQIDYTGIFWRKP